MRADPELVAAWVRGWALSREVAAPTPQADGFRVEVGWPDQVRRFVFPALSDEIARLGREIDAPFVYLKACASAEALRRVLGPPWAVTAPRYMMTVGDLNHPAPGLPQGYRLDVGAGRSGPIAVVAAGDEVAATGRVVTVDRLAVFDRIVTDPGHQRRGLGTVVMAALGQAAHDLGATRGVLVATEAGRGLYESLGWRLHSPYASAVIAD
jgi:GNAT superfamily N-acetyltransferase